MQVSIIGSNEDHGEMFKMAYELGKRLASDGHIVINGGRGGIMEGAAMGANEGNGTVIGILPASNRHCGNDYLTAEIITGIGEMRNFIIVLSGDITVAFPGSFGTLTEISFAIRNGSRMIIVRPDLHRFIRFPDNGNISFANTIDEILSKISEHDGI